VRQQALYLIALRQEFRERLIESPVYLLEHVLELVGLMKLWMGMLGLWNDFELDRIK
jgi:hypothetical protein